MKRDTVVAQFLARRIEHWDKVANSSYTLTDLVLEPLSAVPQNGSQLFEAENRDLHRSRVHGTTRHSCEDLLDVPKGPGVASAFRARTSGCGETVKRRKPT